MQMAFVTELTVAESFKDKCIAKNLISIFSLKIASGKRYTIKHIVCLYVVCLYKNIWNDSRDVCIVTPTRAI